MLDKKQLREDLGIAKALIWLPDDVFRWCRVHVLSGPNEHGQYHVKRIVNGWEAIATKVQHLSDKNRRDIQDNYL
jgi:hypothetical protein